MYCSGCGYCGIGSVVGSYSAQTLSGYSPLERAAYSAQMYVLTDQPNTVKFDYFKAQNYKKVSYRPQQKITATYVHNPWLFLKPNRPVSRFVGDAFEISEFIDEAFKITAGKELPDNISISLCSKEELMMLHSCFGGLWREGILGFAVNGSTGSIFVMKNNLDILMPTIGHELGHVLSPTLKNPVEEEAKAFAFEIAWVKTIQEHNIANLGEAVDMGILSPANNGIHDTAFDFIKRVLLDENKTALELYWEIASGFRADAGPGSFALSKAKGFEP